MTRTANERGRAPLKRARGNLVMPPDPLTVIEVCYDVAPGNTLYIRGQGDGLSWDSGQRLTRGFGARWIWTTNQARGKVRFRLLLNDRIWAKGRDVIVEAGKLTEVAPAF